MKSTEPYVQYYTFEDLLEKDGYIVFTNVGYSMMPLLRQKRDVIVIRKKTPEERCKKYDVVLYKRKERYILHRVLRVRPTGYIIAGDNNAFIEKDVTDEMIIGIMSKVMRNGKAVSTDNLGYKFYTHIWCDCYPVRICIFKIRTFIYRCIRFLKRKVFG